MMMLVEREVPAQNAPSGASGGQMNCPVVELYLTPCAEARAAEARTRAAVYFMMNLVVISIVFK
jgi:hypothetical protein